MLLPFAEKGSITGHREIVNAGNRRNAGDEIFYAVTQQRFTAGELDQRQLRMLADKVANTLERLLLPWERHTRS